MLQWKTDKPANAGKMVPVSKGKASTEPSWSYVQKVIGEDTWLVMAQSQIELEDEFSSLYYTAQNQSNIFLMPPYEPLALMNLVQANNTLNQCITAMEVNIDGTGIDFDPAEGVDEVDEDEESQAISFFNEPYPQVSFVNIRRKLRRQIETIGYSFLEVLRNLDGEVVGFRNIETHNVRMVKLDMPVMVTKEMERDGETVEFQMWVRERRFAQRVALKTLVYYKEFGATRDVDRNTGKWSTDTEAIAPENRGTELLMFGLVPDVTTPYFLPRWINEMPSVVGSRKAEEQNLQFLDSGGMPPAIIFIQGGTLGKDASDQLKTYLSGKNKNKQRAVVIEAQSSSGSMDSAGNVQVKVERFGAPQAQDAMFMKYDALTEEHVRVGFRLPPIFLGKPADYNFATAVTAYMVTEAQVFQPERDAFDDIMNKTILKAMGWKTLSMKSKPISLKDPTNQMNLLATAKDLATRESLLDEINNLTGFNLQLAAQPQPDSVAGSYVATNPDGSPVQPNATLGGRPLPVDPKALAAQQTPPALPAPSPTPARGTVQKPAFQTGPPQSALPIQNQGMKPAPKAPLKKTAMELIDLALDFATSRGLVRKRELTEERVLQLEDEVASLDADDFSAFNRLVAKYTYGSDSRGATKIARRVRECN